MKLFVIVSSLDLTQPFSATPSWWQLFKALYEIGVEVIAAPYQGPAIEAPWWQAAPNPARREGDLFGRARRLPAHQRDAGGSGGEAGTGGEREALPDRAVRRLAHTVIAPRWRRHVTACSRAIRTSTRCWSSPCR